MRLRRPLRSAAASVVIVTACAAAGSVLAGCSSTAGPLQSFTAKGQPIVTDASLAVLPGQAEDATTYVVNSSHEPVTLVSASLTPAPGYRAPKLSHVAVDTTLHVIGVAANWPPSVPVRAFTGAKLPYGESRITFAISGQRVGVNYGTAGLKIIYSYRGKNYSVVAWSAVLTCVTTRKNVGNPAECGDAITNRLMTTVIKMASR